MNKIAVRQYISTIISNVSEINSTIKKQRVNKKGGQIMELCRLQEIHFRCNNT